MNLIIQFSRPLFFRIHKSLLYNILLKALLKSRLSINIIYPGWACYAAWTLEVTKKKTKRVNYFFLAPIQVYSNSSCTSATSYMYSITIFFRSFFRVFFKVIGWQLSRREQSFFFTFYRITVVITLKYLGSLPLQRHAIAALVSGVTITSTAALIALFRILSSPGTLLVGSFYIASFISFTDIVWLISIEGGRDWLLVSCRSAWPAPGIII